jgi:hypothetical protein
MTLLHAELRSADALVTGGVDRLSAASFAALSGVGSRAASSPHTHVLGLQFPMAQDDEHHQSEMLGVRLLHSSAEEAAAGPACSAPRAFCGTPASSSHTQAFDLQRPSVH